MDKISLIIPCYNEEESIPLLYQELDKVSVSMKDVNFEFIFIDNCSEDGTLTTIKSLLEKDQRIKFISFSRNFGKEASMYAGLKVCTGDYAAIMDADLQDPPELLIEMYKAVKNEGYDSAATYRSNRKNEPAMRSAGAGVFYRLMNKLSGMDVVSGARDYRLMSRQMVNAVLSMEENERFSKGIFSWVGFKTKWIAFSNRERVAGKTKLPTKSAVSYGFKGITSFSTKPLILTSILGMVFCIIAFIYTVYVVLHQLITGEATPGYASLMCVTLFGFGFLFLVLGIIGQYIAEMYLEIKNRPKYIIRETNLDDRCDS